ncbi:MAG: DoxX family protein [Flavobacteriales bacterium]|nr:DoxX family protein [Flavobacteriales bacterium]
MGSASAGPPSAHHARSSCLTSILPGVHHLNLQPSICIRTMILNSQPISEDLGYLLMRLGFGGTMLWQHGWPKLMRFGERMDSFSDPLGLSSPVSLALIVFAEVVCAALVVLGLWTRAALVPLIIAMGVIIFLVDRGQPFGESELALVYLLGYLALLFTGSGRFAVDRISFK